MTVRHSTASPYTLRTPPTAPSHRPALEPACTSNTTTGGLTDIPKPGTQPNKTTGSELERQIFGKQSHRPKKSDIPVAPPTGYRDPRPTPLPKNNGRDREAHARHVRRQLGIPEHATSQAVYKSTTMKQLQAWAKGLAQAAAHYLWPEPPGPAAQGVVLFDHDFGQDGLNPPGHTRGSLLNALKKLYPVDVIHFVALDPACQYPFPRNLAGKAPDGVMLLADDPNDEPRRWDCAREALIEGFKQLNVAFRVVPFNINFADVTWEGEAIFFVNGEKQQGLLFISNAHDLNHYEQIRQAFGAPPYTVYANTDKNPRTMPRSAAGQPGCYDADLGRSAVMTDAKNERSTVVIHEPCFDDGAVLNLQPDGRYLHKTRSLSEMMEHLGIGVIQGSKDDHQRMVPNLIVSSYEPDKVLLPDPDTSKGMRHQLRTKAARTPVVGEALLGHAGVTEPPFAIHCTTLELPGAPGKASAQARMVDDQTPRDRRDL